MSLLADAVVYIFVLLAVLVVVAAIMYGVAHLRKPTPEESQDRVTRAYQDALGPGPGAQRTA